MASDVVSQIDQQSRNIADLLAFITKELDADAERHARLQTAAAAAGEVLQDGQNGVTIDLSKSNIRALPVEAIELMKDRVERLAVSHNPQISIPTEIIQCERLRYLNIRWNQLTEFPDAVLQLSKLEILDLSRNRLTSIPEGIKKLQSLKFLAIAKNRITRLPLALGEMSSLGKLKFDENPLEFPPPETYKLSNDHSVHEPERDKEICQMVKRFLRETSLQQQKLRAFSDEEISEDHVVTPRPPRRSVTAGRFPIRPSISGMESLAETRADTRVDSTSEATAPPPIPERSHARGESSNTSIVNRSGIAPLTNNDTDTGRSRSETVAASANLRQRRRGFVPGRKPAGDLTAVSEDLTQSRPSPLTGSSHTRDVSSTSTANSSVDHNSTDTPGSASPARGRLGQFRKLSSYPEGQTRPVKNYPAYKFANRLIYSLPQLSTPLNSVIMALTDGAPLSYSIGRQMHAARDYVLELGRHMNEVMIGTNARNLSESDVTLILIRDAVRLLKVHAAFFVEMKRRSEKLVRYTDGHKLRPFLLQVQGFMIELRNACLVLGVHVIERTTTQDKPRVSRAWSSKSVTPTQPKAPTNRRQPRPPMLQGVGANAMPRAPLRPPLPVNSDRSRTSTMTSEISVESARSESFPLSAGSHGMRSRSNTIRSFADDSEGDDQFGKIFLKLQAACNVVSQALPHCRREFQARKEACNNVEQRHLSQQWSMLIGKVDEVMSNSRALKKRLEVVKIADPGPRPQRDFWQLCDAFVLSWTEFATDVKDISQQRVDISSIKHAMRNVQRHVKDASKMVFNSPLYHHAVATNRNKVVDPTNPQNMISPTPQDILKVQAAYLASPNIPATPLSAALGPAVHAAVATPTTSTVPREYFPEPPTPRQARDRYDTPMQNQLQQPYGRRY